MKRYVINLDRSPRRLTRMEALFGLMDLDFCRVAAFDGRTLSPEEVTALTTPKSDGMPWTHQEVGVAISHRRCWQMIVESGDAFGAVFEDDLYFSGDAAQYLRNSDWLPDGIDVLKLETVGGKVTLGLSGKSVGARRIHRLHSNHWGAGAYIVSASLAKRLVEQTQIFADQPDVVLFRQPCEILACQLTPAICIQDLVLNGVGSNEFLSSTLESERVPLRALPKPRGWKKVQRELERPLKQLAAVAKDVVQPLLGKRRIRVPFQQ